MASFSLCPSLDRRNWKYIFLCYEKMLPRKQPGTENKILIASSHSS